MTDGSSNLSLSNKVLGLGSAVASYGTVASYGMVALDLVVHPQQPQPFSVVKNNTKIH